MGLLQKSNSSPNSSPNSNSKPKLKLQGHPRGAKSPNGHPPGRIGPAPRLGASSRPALGPVVRGASYYHNGGEPSPRLPVNKAAEQTNCQLLGRLNLFPPFTLATLPSLPSLPSLLTVATEPPCCLLLASSPLGHLCGVKSAVSRPTDCKLGGRRLSSAEWAPLCIPLRVWSSQNSAKTQSSARALRSSKARPKWLLESTLSPLKARQVLLFLAENN